MGIGPDALNRQSVKPLAPGRTPGDAAVNTQGTDTVHLDGAGIRQPVDDINIMCTFLQQQRTGVLAVGMPVTEIGITAIAHEMPAPNRLDFTDHAGQDDFSHPVRKFHVAHIVTEHQMGSVLFGRPQNPVGAFDGDGDRFFQINRGFVPQGETGLLLVAEIGGSDEYAVQFFFFDHLTIVGINIDDGLLCLHAFGKAPALFFIDIRTGDDLHSVCRLMSVISQFAATAGSDDSEFQFFHDMIPLLMSCQPS